MKVLIVDDKFVCAMSKDEFVGIFRTIGGTNKIERETSEYSLLTAKESEAVSEAFATAWFNSLGIQEERGG